MLKRLEAKEEASTLLAKQSKEQVAERLAGFPQTFAHFDRLRRVGSFTMLGSYSGMMFGILSNNDTALIPSAFILGAFIINDALILRKTVRLEKDRDMTINEAIARGLPTPPRQKPSV